MIRTARGTRGLGGLALLALAVLPPSALAQQLYDYDINRVGDAVAVELDNPDYPGDTVRRGQEGWVRMSFVVTPDGRAVDPIILDSSGGGGFETEARAILEKWRFEPGDAEVPWNFVDIRTEINRGKDRITNNFGRRYQRVMRHLYDEENEAARSQIDETYKVGGWNLYESTMFWLMMGRVEGVEDDHAGKLEAYSRALAMGKSNAITNEDRATLLERIFLLQVHFNQLAAANRTHIRLQGVEENEESLQRLAERIAEVQAKLDNDATLTAKAVIYNPCDCDEGEPLWVYSPARRTFSFANTDGNVERFEARCETGRIGDDIEPGKSWTLAPEWGSCRVIVFGKDGATFDFLEHRSEEHDSAAAEAVARNHVLDRRDRRQ